MPTHTDQAHLYAQDTVAKTVLAAAQAKRTTARGRRTPGPVDDAPATCHSTRMGSGGAGDVGRTRLSRPHGHARGTMSHVATHGTADHTAERQEDGQR